jgi:Protein of unknown function (DUF2474)
MARRESWTRRIAWLLLLWAAGVASMGALAALLRGMMRWAGLV